MLWVNTALRLLLLFVYWCHFSAWEGKNLGRHQCSKLWPSTPYTLKTTVFCLLEYLLLKTCALWELLSIILKWIVCISYFLVDSDGKIVTQQEGTFRSNCMDCLDRTNVIQSLLARRSLQAQLQVNILFLFNKLEEESSFLCGT